MFLEKFTAQIPEGSNIAIFGTGEIGLEIKKFIDKNRPDLKINFFIDSYKSGKCEDINIINLKELEANKSLIDYAIITTRNYAHDIVEIFNFLNTFF